MLASDALPYAQVRRERVMAIAVSHLSPIMEGQTIRIDLCQYLVEEHGFVSDGVDAETMLHSHLPQC